MSKYLVLNHPCFIDQVFIGKSQAKNIIELDSKTVVTFFGFIHERKGLDVLIRAMVNLPKDTILLIAGKPSSKEYLAELRQLVKFLNLTDRILFYGYVPDDRIPVIMNASDVVVLPYSVVTQSGAIYYPLAYGIPVIASDISGFKELNEHDCLTLFKSGDAQDLGEKIKYVLDNQYSSDIMGKVGRGKTYCEKVGYKEMTRKLVALYEELLCRFHLLQL